MPPEEIEPPALSPQVLNDMDVQADRIIAEKMNALDTAVRPPGLTAAIAPTSLRGRAREKAAGFLTAWVNGDQGQMKALGEGTPSAGGYIVPDELRAEITQRATELSRMSKLVRRIGCKSNTIKVPTLTTDVAVSWGSENVAFDESDPVFGQPTISINRLNAVTKVSRELVSDSGIDLVDYLSTLFAEAIAVEEDRVIAIGSGTGQPEGLYNAAGVQEYAVGGPIDYDALVDIYYTLPGRYRDNAVWLGHGDIFKAVRKLVDTAGSYVWNPSLETGEPPRLLGRPIVQEDLFPDGFLMFGAPRYYQLYDREDFSVEASTQAGTAFLAHQLWLKVWERIDGKLMLAEAWVKGTGIT